jgi:hypothetical protein
MPFGARWNPWPQPWRASAGADEANAITDAKAIAARAFMHLSFVGG